MNSKFNTIKKIALRMVISLGVLAVAAVIFLYGKYISKYNNLVLYTNPSGSQQIYILGTIHEYHFNRLLGFSYLDVQNAVANIQPDLLLLEVDQQVFEEHGVVKSPVEMLPLWCYAQDNRIAVKGVDWFEVNDGSRSWTTDKVRDDHIFANTLAAIKDEPVVLVVLGATHRMEQSKRFEAQGYKPVKIPDKSALYRGNDGDDFAYPEGTIPELEKQISYWQTVAPHKAMAVTTQNSQGRDYWLNRYVKLIASLEKLKQEIFTPNRLYQ